MKIACALALIAGSAFGEAITTNPATPAPNEPFTINVRDAWPNGCPPSFQSVTAVGSTILVTATETDCNKVCPQLVTQYSIDTNLVTVPGPGIYTIEYHIIDCSQKDTIAGSATLPVNFHCQFDRALHAAAPAARVGSSLLLHWCDPSVIVGADQGLNVSFYRVLVARSANGPFVPIGDVKINDVAVTFDSTDVGSLFFFVEAHMCSVTIAGCSGDTVLRTNIVRVDVVASGACLPDVTTLCLENSRFQVKAKWTTKDSSGDGQAVSLTGNSGYFWFFGADNVEVVVKLLNACATPTPSFWFFASGLTNVGVDLTVTDTNTGATKTYHNPLNQPFVAIQDTGAFSTCP